MAQTCLVYICMKLDSQKVINQANLYLLTLSMTMEHHSLQWPLQGLQKDGLLGLGILIRLGQRTCIFSAFSLNIAILSKLPGFSPSCSSTLTPYIAPPDLILLCSTTHASTSLCLSKSVWSSGLIMLKSPMIILLLHPGSCRTVASTSICRECQQNDLRELRYTLRKCRTVSGLTRLVRPTQSTSLVYLLRSFMQKMLLSVSFSFP